MSDNATFDFECPHCQQRLRVPADAAGKRIRCPECQAVITAPGPTDIAAEAPRPTSPPPTAPSEPTGITEEAPRPSSGAERPIDPYDDAERELERDRERARERRRDRDDYDDDDIRNDVPLRKRSSGASGLIAAAICMLLIAGLALLLDLLNVVLALADPNPAVDPNQPPFMQELTRNSRGPVAAATQGFLALIAAFTILGSIQMLRQKTWGLCLAASILSMVHFGSCCCVLGLPVGIWALVMLVNPDVKESFT